MMTRLDELEVTRSAPRTDITLRFPPNWTAVLFFAALGMLHLYMATTAFLHHRWEGFMSLVLGMGFCGISLAARVIATHITVSAADRRVRHRFGYRCFSREKSIPFSRVTMVRLTLMNPADPRSAQIEIIYHDGVIDCPPTDVPREEALCLAMTMGVRLVKVFADGFNTAAERLDQLPSA